MVAFAGTNASWQGDWAGRTGGAVNTSRALVHATLAIAAGFTTHPEGVQP
jgi:hypothetical protein